MTARKLRLPGTGNPYPKGTPTYWGYEHAAARAEMAEAARATGRDLEAGTPKGPVTLGDNHYRYRAAGGTRRVR